MKDFGHQYRTAIYNLLRDHIFISETENIPVYADQLDDSISPYTTEDPPKRYIVLSNQNEVDQSNKHTFNFTTTIQVDCYSIFPAGKGNYAKSEEMSNAVKQLMMPDHVGKIYVDGFNCWRGRVDLARYLREGGRVYDYYRKIIIFSHSVEEAQGVNPNQTFDYTLNFYLS